MGSGIDGASTLRTLVTVILPVNVRKTQTSTAVIIRRPIDRRI